MTIKYYGVVVALYSLNKEDDHLCPEIIQCLRNLTRIQRHGKEFEMERGRRGDM